FQDVPEPKDSAPGHSDYPDLAKVPSCYHNIKEMSRSKSRATSLPPHRDLSSGYHPESNGQTEHMNQDSPFQVVFGYQPPLFPANEEEVTVPLAHAMVRRCRRVWAAVRRVLLRGQARIKKADDRHSRSYAPGQKVWLPTKDLPLHVHTRKLAPRYLRVHPTFHVSRIKPIQESSLVPAAKQPPLPKMVEGGPVYTVKRLLAARKRGRGRQFLVDWEGYGPEERPWIPVSFVVDQALIEEFD
ncbi:hypothetical protein L3Q82_015716, partial [Scortum barcoo]